MSDLIEVTKNCPACGKPTTYRTSKAVANVQCRHCGRGVYLGKQLIADARAALLPQQRNGRSSGGYAAAAPLPDQSAEWAAVRPFDRLSHRPRPDGVCSACGADTNQGSPRGTFVWCQCKGLSYDDATADRTTDALTRIDAAAQRAQSAAELARIDQAPALDLNERMELNGQINLRHTAIAAAVSTMRDAQTGDLFKRAAIATGRLQILDRAFGEAASSPDPYDTLGALDPDLAAELHAAARVATEIGQERVEREVEESRAKEQARLIERHQARTAIEAAPTPRPSIHSLLIAAPTRNGPLPLPDIPLLARAKKKHPVRNGIILAATIAALAMTGGLKFHEVLDDWSYKNNRGKWRDNAYDIYSDGSRELRTDV